MSTYQSESVTHVRDSIAMPLLMVPIGLEGREDAL